MSDLETTAHEAVARIQPLVDALDQAQHECDAAIRYVHALHEQLAADRQALQTAVAALEHDTEHTEQALAALASGATTNLGHLGEAAAAAAADWEERLGKEDDALAGGTALLAELGARVKQLGEKAESTRQEVLDWTTSVGEHLESTVEAVEQAISVGLVATIADYRRDMEAAAARLVEFLEKDCEDLLHAKKADLADKLPQALEVLAHALDGIGAHENEVGSYVIEHWAQLFATQLDAVQSPVHALADGLDSLRQAGENAGGQLQAVTEMVSNLQQQAADDATKLGQGFAAARARWAAIAITP